jgi:hypothetical protein
MGSFMICNPYQYCKDGQIKNDEMGSACVAHEVQAVWWERLKERVNLENRSINGL